MAAPNDVTSMALFCDFENIALGVRDAKYDKFDIGKVLERLLLKGSIVVKKAYCDWDRYKAFKAAMHEAVVRADRDPARAAVGQELRRHPHGRRRARPLLHEGARRHVRHHQRRLGLLAARVEAAREQQGRDRRRREELDVGPPDQQLRRVHLLRRPRAREQKKAAARQAAARSPRTARPRPRSGDRQDALRLDERDEGRAPRRGDAETATGDEARADARSRPPEADQEARRARADERGRRERRRTTRRGSDRPRRRDHRGADRRARRDDKIWGSMVKQALKRRKPGFNEVVLRLPLVQRACSRRPRRRGSLELERDEKSGGYLVRLASPED